MLEKVCHETAVIWKHSLYIDDKQRMEFTTPAVAEDGGRMFEPIPYNDNYGLSSDKLRFEKVN